MSGSSSSDAGNGNRDDIVLVPESNRDSAKLEPEQPNRSEVAGDLATEVPEPTRTPFWGRAKKALGDASTRVSTTGVAVALKATEFGASGVAMAAELGKQTYVAAGNAADASGATEAIKATAGAVAGKLDEVSGKRLVELLEQKLRIQDSYNDVLATRLAEALERLSILEDRVNELTSPSQVFPMFATEIRDEDR